MESHIDPEIQHIGSQSVKHYMSSRDKANKEALFRLYLLLLALLTFIGEEAVKVIFRNNFGVKGISLTKLFLCFLVLMSISAYSFYLSYYFDDFAASIATDDVHYGAGLFYLIVAFTIIIKGIKERSKAVKHTDFSDYTGDSSVLGFLKKDKWWNQERIQLIAEPALILSLGISFCLFDPLAGVPLIFFAASVWLSSIVRKLLFGETLYDTVNKLNEANGSNNFHEVTAE